MPKISVVMSVYKEPVDWIRISINSILNQSFSDFEFIIVNDEPNREENRILLDEYSKRDDRVKVITNEANIGLTKSLNKGISLAEGEYVARMDADDISLPKRFAIQSAVLDANKTVAVVGSCVQEIDEKGNMGKIRHLSSSSQYLRSMVFLDSPVVHPASMFRRVLDGKPVLYDESYRFAQDYALWATIIRDHEIVNLKNILLHYRVSDNQISQKRIEAQNENSRRIMDFIIDYYDLHCSSECRELIMVITKDKSLRYEKQVIVSNITQFILDNRGNQYIKMHYLSNKLIVSLTDYVRTYYGKAEARKVALCMVCQFGHYSLKTIMVLIKLCTIG